MEKGRNNLGKKIGDKFVKSIAFLFDVGDKIFYSSIPILILMGVLLISSFIGIGAFIFYDKQIPVSLTNIAFAIQIAIASVCFSWVRTFDLELYKQLTSSIRRTGEASLLAAIFFLIGSIIKYFLLTFPVRPASNVGYIFIYHIISYVLYGCIMIAGLKFITVLLRLVIILRNMQKRPLKDFNIDE